MFLDHNELKAMYQSFDTNDRNNVLALIFTAQTGKDVKSFYKWETSAAEYIQKANEKKWSQIAPKSIDIFGKNTYSCWYECKENTDVQGQHKLFISTYRYFKSINIDVLPSLMKLLLDGYQHNKDKAYLIHNVTDLLLEKEDLADTEEKKELMSSIMKEVIKINWQDLDIIEHFLCLCYKKLSKMSFNKEDLVYWTAQALINNKRVNIEDIVTKKIKTEDLKEHLPPYYYKQLMERKYPVIEKLSIPIYFKLNADKECLKNKIYVHSNLEIFQEVFEKYFQQSDDYESFIIKSNEKQHDIVAFFSSSKNINLYRLIIEECLLICIKSQQHNNDDCIEQLKELFIKTIDKCILDFSLPQQEDKIVKSKI